MQEKLLTIINHYGVNAQQRQLQEEVFELQEAITLQEKEFEYFDIDTDLNNALTLEILSRGQDNITEELADVLVLLEQIRLYYNIELDDVEGVFRAKVDRQIDRIAKENE